MNDQYVSRCAVYAWSAWAIAGVLLGIVWYAAAESIRPPWLLALCLTTCFAIGIAVTLHVRSYMVRLCALVRTTAGLSTPDEKVRNLR